MLTLNKRTAPIVGALLALVLCLPAIAHGQNFGFGPWWAGTFTSEAPMVVTDTPATSDGWTAIPLFTVPETLNGYQPTGIFDGIGAFRLGNTVVTLINSELNEGNGYEYTLANGTVLNGARIHRMDLNRRTGGVLDAALAYDTVYDRQGVIVTDPAQINEDGNANDGFARFCSGRTVLRGERGMLDTIHFAGEESSPPFHPTGGSFWALDVKRAEIWGVPAMGRGGWENLTPVATGNFWHTAFILGDDVQGAPLYLYVGNRFGAGMWWDFLDRNGLRDGQLYVWAADNGDLDPQTFNGSGSTRSGTFLPIEVQDVTMAGMPGYDAYGYKNQPTLHAEADAMGAFSFSRPEDVHDNPFDGGEVIFASTGRGGLFPADNWGTIYRVELDLSDVNAPKADLTIVVDADELADPDSGIRSPDNLTWARNGKVYVQEDRSTSPGSLFGGTSGVDASIWELDPYSGAATRIAEVDPTATPAGTTNGLAGVLGGWETLGVLDVTRLFELIGTNFDTVLLIAVQAHGVDDGPIGGNPLLDEASQLMLLAK